MTGFMKYKKQNLWTKSPADKALAKQQAMELRELKKAMNKIQNNEK